jgi:hypothetical protein
MMTRTENCTCGAAITITASHNTVDDVLAVWRQTHSGTGHEPTTARQSYMAWVRAEEKQRKEREQ